MNVKVKHECERARERFKALSPARRDAVKQQLAQAAQRRAQAENEARKREKEFEKLKLKLSSLVNDKRREVVCATMQIGKPTAGWRNEVVCHIDRPTD